MLQNLKEGNEIESAGAACVNELFERDTENTMGFCSRLCSGRAVQFQPKSLAPCLPRKIEKSPAPTANVQHAMKPIAFGELHSTEELRTVRCEIPRPFEFLVKDFIASQRGIKKCESASRAPFERHEGLLLDSAPRFRRELKS